MTRDGDVSGIDTVADVDVFAEIRARHWLQGLLPNERDVARIDASASIDITKEDAHWHRHIGRVRAVVDAYQRDGYPLRVWNASEVNEDLIAAGCDIAN